MKNERKFIKKIRKHWKKQNNMIIADFGLPRCGMSYSAFALIGVEK